MARYDKSSQLETVPRDCCLGECSQSDDWKVYARRVRWTWLPGKKRRINCFFNGYVLDTKFGPRYDVSKPPYSHPHSTGRPLENVSQESIPPQQHTKCSPKVISASAATENLLQCARVPWIMEHPCEPWLCDVPTVQTLAAQPRTAWALADFCVFLDHRAGGTSFEWTGIRAQLAPVAYLSQALIATCYVGDTRWSCSEKDDDSILHTHDLCRTTRETPDY